MKMKQGIQLYTVRDLIQTVEDTEKTFAYIKDFGCDVVQISGIGDIAPKTVQALVERFGFDVCVTHKPFERMVNDLDALIEEHRMIGCDTIGIGSMPGEYRDDPDKVLAFARLASKIGEKMAKQGMRLAYHNHDFEFRPLPSGKTSMEILLENTDPALFGLIPDVAWLQIAGMDACRFLRENKARIKVVHMKDYCFEGEKRRFIEFGKGRMDFDAVYRTCGECDIPYAVYEQDCDWSESALASCKYSYEKMLETAAKID